MASNNEIQDGCLHLGKLLTPCLGTMRKWGHLLDYLCMISASLLSRYALSLQDMYTNMMKMEFAAPQKSGNPVWQCQYCPHRVMVLGGADGMISWKNSPADQTGVQRGITPYKLNSRAVHICLNTKTKYNCFYFCLVFFPCTPDLFCV